MGTLPSKRDLRIDLFRGLALVVIYIDHIPYNRFSHLTLRNFGFTSAADIFVLLAGIAFALAYAPRLDTRGIDRHRRAPPLRVVAGNLVALG